MRVGRSPPNSLARPGTRPILSAQNERAGESSPARGVAAMYDSHSTPASAAHVEYALNCGSRQDQGRREAQCPWPRESVPSTGRGCVIEALRRLAEKRDTKRTAWREVQPSAWLRKVHPYERV